MKKKILIAGKNSYIGNKIKLWINKRKPGYKVFHLDMRNSAWENFELQDIDIVINVTGIAHKNEKTVDPELYYKVNRDLAIKLAELSKEAGVSQYIFLSSMSVYGNITGEISNNTLIKPNSNYGKSKFEAEQLLHQLDNSEFKICIIRPPMVYGKHAKGNYNKLSNFIKRFPVFPNVNNKRSMIYIDNLTEFIYQCIERDCNGVFCPQNTNLVSTKEMVNVIATMNNRKIFIIPNILGIFNVLIKNVEVFSKVLGDLYYNESLEIPFEYNVVSFKESIEVTECE